MILNGTTNMVSGMWENLSKGNGLVLESSLLVGGFGNVSRGVDQELNNITTQVPNGTITLLVDVAYPLYQQSQRVG